MIVVIATLHDKKDAVRIGKGLLEKRLIACYNLWPIESAYWWKGRILDEKETFVFMKSQAKHFEAVRAYIKKGSGYEIPEVIALAPKDVDKSFAGWVKSETGG